MVQTHPMQRETLISGATERTTPLVAGITYSVSCRSKKEAEDVGPFLASHFPHIPLENIDSVFGFRERSTLYGGRQFLQPEFSDADITWLAERGVGLKLPVSNHVVSEEKPATEQPAWIIVNRKSPRFRL